MIKKINFNNSTIVDAVCAHKINEIINILNAIVVETKDGTFIDGSKKAEPVDKFAEQRKWIGTLCKFWDGVNKKYVVYGIFDKINENHSQYVYVAKNGVHYEYCEPVKPDDDLIYKGE